MPKEQESGSGKLSTSDKIWHILFEDGIELSAANKSRIISDLNRIFGRYRGYVLRNLNDPIEVHVGGSILSIETRVSFHRNVGYDVPDALRDMFGLLVSEEKSQIVVTEALVIRYLRHFEWLQQHEEAVEKLYELVALLNEDYLVQSVSEDSNAFYVDNLSAGQIEEFRRNIRKSSMEWSELKWFEPSLFSFQEASEEGLVGELICELIYVDRTSGSYSRWPLILQRDRWLLFVPPS